MPIIIGRTIKSRPEDEPVIMTRISKTSVRSLKIIKITVISWRLTKTTEIYMKQDQNYTEKKDLSNQKKNMVSTPTTMKLEMTPKIQ